MNFLQTHFIGDPTFIGWFTVGTYMLAAGLCAAFALQIERLFFLYRFRWHRVVWLIFAIALVLLGLNKQMDLQTSLTRFGRELAFIQGWYDVRRVFQLWFVVAVAICSFVLLIIMVWTLRQTLRLYWLALLGFVSLMTFIVIRSVSFHYVDILLGMDLAGFKLNWALELGGIGLICLSAWLNLRYARRATQITRPIAAVGGVIYRQTETGAKEYLLLQKAADTWTWPRGLIAPAEQRQMAIANEMYQLTGIQGKVGSVICQVLHINEDNRKRRRKLATYYLITAISEQPAGEAGQNQPQIGWFSRKQALSLIHSRRMREVLRQADGMSGNQRIDSKQNQLYQDGSTIT